MHGILSTLKNLQLKARGRKSPTYHPAWPLHDGEISRPDLSPQQDCPLFGRLSAELRIMIYKAVLSDPSRFLHICRNLPQKKSRQARPVAHFWCIDMESPFPTWQHTCYGEKWDPPGMVYRSTTQTDDKLLSLLLTCRIIYSESLPVLYQENVFHFRGGPSLLAFRDSITSHQWLTIRHVHISSFHTQEGSMPGGENTWPPEHLDGWGKCFDSLREIKTLETLKLDIMVEFIAWRQSSTHNTELILMNALKLMRSVPARVFEVEINIDPPQTFWNTLGEVDFVVTITKRKYNKQVYSMPPMNLLCT